MTWSPPRQNDRRLVTDRNRMVKNRDHWTVEAVHRNGSVVVAGRTGRVVLPAEYVASNVELAYAETSHANQGRTVDRSFLCLDGPTGASGIYVPLSRGRESNDAYVVVQGEQTPADVVAEALSRTWVDRPAVAVRAEMRSDVNRGAAGGSENGRCLAGAEVRQLMERVAEIERDLAIARAEPDMLRRHLDDLARKRDGLERSISDHEAKLDRACRILAEHDHPVVWRLHRVDVEGARHEIDWLPAAIKRDQGSLARTGAQESLATGRLEKAVLLANGTPELLAELAMVRHQLDGDLQARGAQASAEPAAVEALGPMPAGGATEALWRDAAGHLLQHGAAFDGSGEPPGGQAQRLIREEAYRSSRRAVQEAGERLDRCLGRQLEIEPPHRSLGLSL